MRSRALSRLFQLSAFGKFEKTSPWDLLSMRKTLPESRKPLVWEEHPNLFRPCPNKWKRIYLGRGGWGGKGGKRGGRAQDMEVSGGQQQRLALSRTFMRSNDENVRLWMFDEPSASLDPLAEFNLFERLRDMRGTNTMIFSTHRYGGLTRYADLILYLKDARVAEMGTHDELMGLNGDYAQLYNVQAQAFRQDT
ncbi:unnamed protein product [Rhizoctonia solani]|uniref:ABC transporter domain-containing protein n=1 Tax=Rhizoctonia solani TaxID=456999 RepID=A0A8H3DFX8_9AGAM|nr:unnamed protein product [Rhizoctonia solani]